MANAVSSPNEINIAGVYYKIDGPVRRSLASVYPGKLVTGDYTKDSNPILSTLALSDHRGGIGQDIYDGDGPANRSWYSTADTRFRGHLILPPLVTNTGGLPAGLSAIQHLVVYQGDVYANVTSTASGVFKYTPGSNSWGANLLSIAGQVGVMGRWATVDIAGASYITFGTSGSKYALFDGTTWSEITVGQVCGWPAEWDNRLWVVSLTSPFKLLFTLTPAVNTSWTALTQTPTIRLGVKVGQLLVGRDASGEETLYLALPTGLYAYDMGNDKWHETGLQLPDNAGVAASNFASAVRWRDDIYFGTRSNIFQYHVASGIATVTPIGPNLDDGLPSTKGYIVMDMVASLNDLIASFKGYGSETKTSIIMAWNGVGWRVLYEGGNEEQLWPLLVAGTVGAYKLWWANNTTSPYNISWLALPSEVATPLQVTGYTYAAAATHDWPWFTAGQSDVTKVAVRVKVETVNPTTAETVKVYYAINRSTTFQLMTNSTYTTGVITAAGIHTFDFPSVDSWVSTTALTGTAFRSIQFRVVFARGATTTNTPEVLSLTLEYYKKMDSKWQFQVAVNVTEGYKGNTPKQLRAALLTAQETAILQEFTYRDPVANSDATFYVQVQPVEGQEQTGLDERGNLLLLLREV